MERTILLLYSIFLFSPFSLECNRSVYYKLHGNWIADDELGAVRMVFSKDGVATIQYKEGVELEGTWKIDTDGTIQINMEIWNIQATIKDKRLILTNNNNSKSYKKMK